MTNSLKVSIACSKCGEVVQTTSYADIEDDDFYCDDCEQSRAEAAYERLCEDFHDGGSSWPKSLLEQQIEARKLK